MHRIPCILSRSANAPPEGYPTRDKWKWTKHLACSGTPPGSTSLCLCVVFWNLCMLNITEFWTMGAYSLMRGRLHTACCPGKISICRHPHPIRLCEGHSFGSSLHLYWELVVQQFLVQLAWLQECWYTHSNSSPSVPYSNIQVSILPFEICIIDCILYPHLAIHTICIWACACYEFCWEVDQSTSSTELD
jgi:hypothetical protein